MKKYLVLMILMLLIVACAPTAPIPTMEPICKGAVCIQQVSLRVQGDYINVEFDLTNRGGTVLAGEEPFFTGKLLVALYLEEGNTSTYLIGAEISPSGYMCYVGNDIPGHSGELATICNILFPLSKMSTRPQVGDTLRIELDTFDLIRSVKLEKEN